MNIIIIKLWFYFLSKQSFKKKKRPHVFFTAEFYFKKKSKE